MNDAEVKRLAHAINELRPSWPISSLTTFIARNLSNRNYRDAAVALVWVALDADAAGEYVTQTPKRVLEGGPWWKAAEQTGSVSQRFKPPKKHEECRTHPGQYPPPYCGPCATEDTPAYYDPDPKETPMSTGATTGAAVVREQLQQARNDQEAS